ncbi:sigma 54-interacting transcriptional regulator [Sporolituus thermophilus]|uniref:Transcriptional regulator containing PAS, AAA-type ATPase, and DNA-binding Fis domains n=1 Tax=Sporolituus thermophilus DSM 23256 TaxID=1123285 RepID=A0A1G7K8L7_9FIRM|nr:sigma 54-interacting transcriptional regulator [Sporolituus thermophilus]SDF33515.1 Transcriptional regulator containing PAS, AAA-type ATPase, and DNA-binding Fis domains [Sporolituus thermophilus DSM 23256]
MMPILFLAPFHNMAELAANIAQQMGIELYVATASDQEAERVIKRYGDVEVIISRGGLAEEVKALNRFTVIEITMSVYDLLSIVSKLTALDIRRIGIVSRANIFDGITGNFNISETEIHIRSCRNESEIAKTVLELYRQGVEAVIGCRAAYETAKTCGMVAEMLESGATSIRRAIEEAVRIVKAKEREKLQTAQLKAIIDNIDEGVIAVTGNNQLSFYNNVARKICAGEGKELTFHSIKELVKHRYQEKIVTINGSNVIARVIPLEFNNKENGKVVTFHEVASIQASERKIRFSLYQKGLYAKNTFEDIIGQSGIMKKLIEKAKKYALYDSNLLIYGETGTGKEVLAQSIHNHSNRRKGPFVSVNTASIPPSLMESELFGYVEGAFTGARKGGKPGLFELAHGGTIFLDEIGELSPDIQSRLLRVLQEKEIMRIGDDRIIPVDVRIISATNRDLFEQVKQGRFRQDLYYRIHVLGLRLPPLRERPEDIPLIFLYYFNKFRPDKTVKLDPAATRLLISYPWPGNIRQLRNVAEVIAYSIGEADRIGYEQVAEVLGEQEARVDSGYYLAIKEAGSLKQMESEIIRQLLARYGPDEVCAKLGISKVTLWRKTKAPFQ